MTETGQARPPVGAPDPVGLILARGSRNGSDPQR